MKFLSLNKRQILRLVRGAFGKLRTFFAYLQWRFWLWGQTRLVEKYAEAERLNGASIDLMVERYKTAEKKTPGLAAADYWSSTFGNAAVRKTEGKN